MSDSYATRNFTSSGELRKAVTTAGYAVGNVWLMAKSRQTRRKTFFQEWRKFRGLSQERLGEMIGREKATVSRIESGDIAYTREFLEAAADALGTHPGMLLMRGPTEADAMPIQKARKTAP